MNLSALISGLDVRPRVAGAPDVRICDITEDSRTALPGSLFIARRGLRHDGAAHAEEAVAAGAVAVLVESGVELKRPAGAVALETPDAALAMAQLAERFYGAPSTKLSLIGVTGTNGKTTTAHLVHQILNFSRRRCGLIGTVAIDNGVETSSASMTTPSALETSWLLNAMAEAGCDSAVMEVSSHALHQKRAAALRFAVAIFTNLTGDHLDYHGTMESYAAAKAMLFDGLDVSAVAVVNAEDPHSARMLRACRAPALACSIAGAETSAPAGATACIATIERSDAESTDVAFDGPWGRVAARMALVGRHNVMNALQAVAACHAVSVGAEAIQHALHRLSPPPGRLEPVALGAQELDGRPAPSLKVFVDYAHTDDALANVLRAVRPLVPTGAKLRIVFGCGGDRDRTKRPRMGAAACAGADVAIITSDNPRTEDPAAIIAEILTGVDQDRRDGVVVEVDRERAINEVIAGAADGDIVVIAGKGHEDYQILPDGRGGVIRRDFDDRVVAREALLRRAGGPHSRARAGARNPDHAEPGDAEPPIVRASPARTAHERETENA